MRSDLSRQVLLAMKQKSGNIRNRGIWLAIAVGLVLRIALLFAGVDLECTNDECSYLTVAKALLNGQGLKPVRGFLWAPGYPAFLAVAGLFGKATLSLVAKSLQVGLAFGAHLILVAWARRCFGKDVALGTAWLFALYPTLIAFTHYIWPETLYIFFFVLGVGTLLKALEMQPDNPKAALVWILGSSMAFGLAALVRPVALYLLPFVAVWLAWPSGSLLNPESRFRNRGMAAVFVLGCVCTIAPWTLRNWVEYDRFVPVDATLGVNLWRGNATPAVANWDFGFDRRPRNAGIPRGFVECRELPLIDRDRCNTRVSLEVMMDNPGTFLRRLPTKLLDLANPTSFLIRHARWGLYGDLSRGSISVLTFLVVLSFVGVALLSVLGLVAMPEWTAHQPLASRSRELFLMLVFLSLGVHLITFGMSRYRLPLIPLALPFAALAWSRRRELRSLTQRRWRIVVVLWLVLIAAWIRRLPPLLDLDPAVTGPPPSLQSSLVDPATIPACDGATNFRASWIENPPGLHQSGAA